jgi:uncharacterized surface protein with fasciclin (FAS1) repeats
MVYFSIEAQTFDIVQTANNSNFATLVAAIVAANLTSALKGPGPFTVFAPNEAAFGKLQQGTLADLLKPDNKATLVRLLQYHVIGNINYTSAQILNMSLPVKVKTLTGDEVTVSGNASNLMVNNAMIIGRDVMATNGIIHVIDTVLIPPTSATTTSKPSNSAVSLRGNELFFSVLVSTILVPFLHF